MKYKKVTIAWCVQLIFSLFSIVQPRLSSRFCVVCMCEVEKWYREASYFRLIVCMSTVLGARKDSDSRAPFQSEIKV